VFATGYAKVAGGKLEVTDVERFLSVDVDAPDGVVNIALALKIGRVVAAYTATFDVSDCVSFPAPPEVSVAINPAIFGAESGLLSLDFADCAKKDEAGGALHGIFIGRDAICATDGHKLLTRPTTTPGIDFVVPGNVVDTLKKLPPVKTAVISIDGKTLYLTGEGYEFWARTIEGKYPDWEKVVPCGQNCVAELSAAEVAALKAGVDTLLPYAPR